MEKSQEQTFRCERCEYSFKALAHRYEAACCPKCSDSEWVVRVATPYWSMD